MNYIDLLYRKVGSIIYHKHPHYRDWMPDKMYLQQYYAQRMGYYMDFKNPKTFNEKLQWLKLYDRNPIYTKMADKIEAKALVAEKIGEKHIIPTLGIYNSFDEIDFEELPNEFVMKCSHDSGSIFICKDKSLFNSKLACKVIDDGLHKNWYLIGREWAYKNIKPRILIEKYLSTPTTESLTDYKFFCFNGRVKIMFIATDRAKKGGPYFDFYDRDFNHLSIRNGHPNAEIMPLKPKEYDEMIAFAETLSQNIPHVRVDFYDIDGHIYFGEFTFYHFCGCVPFEPKEWDFEIGKWITLK